MHIKGGHFAMRRYTRGKLRGEQNPEECDATKMIKLTGAGYKIGFVFLCFLNAGIKFINKQLFIVTYEQAAGTI